MEQERMQVSFENAIEYFHQDFTVVIEFYEPGATKWYAAYAFNKKHYPNQLPEEITFGELYKAKFFVVGLIAEQLKLELEL